MDLKTSPSEQNEEAYRRVTHDFERDQPYLILVAGLKIDYGNKMKRFFSTAYVCFASTVLLLVISTSFAMVVLTEDKKISLEALHWAVVLCDVLGLIIASRRYASGLDEALETIKAGFFIYEDELPNESYDKIKMVRVSRVRFLSKWFFRLAISSGIFLSFVKLLRNPGKDEVSDPALGMPLPLYVHLEGTSGFALGYSLGVAGLFYLMITTTSSLELFLSLMEQLLAQFDILNLSISNIEQRGYGIYCNKERNKGVSLMEFHKVERYQEYMASCIKENAIHHQCLLRYRRMIEDYVHMIFLLMLLSSGVLIAILICIILYGEEMFQMGILFMLLSAEIAYDFLVCFYGQQLSNESGKVFFSLWDTPFWHFDRRNRSTVHIMMTNSIHPIVLKTSLFNKDISLDTFGGILTTAYQVISIARKTRL